MGSIKATGIGPSQAWTFDAFYPGTNQKLTSNTSSSQQSSAFGTHTSLIRVYCVTDTYVAIGSSPTASSSSMIIPGGGVEYLAVNGSDKIAVLALLTAGTVDITEGAAAT
jgi:hypothetical protein